MEPRRPSVAASPDGAKGVVGALPNGGKGPFLLPPPHPPPQEAINALDNLHEWMSTAARAMEEAEPIGADGPTIAAQLAAQKELNEEILLQRARAKDAVANAKKILRETAAGKSKRKGGEKATRETGLVCGSLIYTSERRAGGIFYKKKAQLREGNIRL